MMFVNDVKCLNESIHDFISMFRKNRREGEQQTVNIINKTESSEPLKKIASSCAKEEMGKIEKL